MTKEELIQQLQELGFFEFGKEFPTSESPFEFMYHGIGCDIPFYRNYNGTFKFKYSFEIQGFLVWSNKNWTKIPPEHTTSISDMMVLYGNH